MLPVCSVKLSCYQSNFLFAEDPTAQNADAARKPHDQDTDRDKTGSQHGASLDPGTSDDAAKEHDDDDKEGSKAPAASGVPASGPQSPESSVGRAKVVPGRAGRGGRAGRRPARGGLKIARH